MEVLEQQGCSRAKGTLGSLFPAFTPSRSPGAGENSAPVADFLGVSLMSWRGFLSNFPPSDVSSYDPDTASLFFASLFFAFLACAHLSLPRTSWIAVDQEPGARDHGGGGCRMEGRWGGRMA